MSSTYVPPPPAPDWAKGSKANKLLPNMIRLVGCFGKYRKWVLVICLLGLVSTGLSIIGPRYLSDMADSVSDSITMGISVDMDYVIKMALILVFIYGLAAILQYISTSSSWIIEEIVGDNLRMSLSEKVSRLSVGTMDGLRSGDIMSRFVNDTDTIRLRSTDCIVNTIDAVALFIGTTVMMFLTEWRLALLSFIPTVAGFVAMRVMVRMSQKYYRAQSRNLGKMNNLVEETFRGLNVIRSYNGMRSAEKDFDEINGTLFTTAFRSRFMAGIMPEISGFINNLSYVLVCVVGSVLVLQGEATFGTIVAFIVYVKLMNQPLMSLSRSLGAMQEVGAASERIFEFMDLPELDSEEDVENRLVDIKGTVELDNISFSYVEGKKVLRDINLKVDAGQKIAIVGPTGAGKTTISNLLLRFYEPDTGCIRIDGVDISTLRRDDVRALFGVVLQESWLFQGTFRQNLVFGNKEVPDEKILEVCEAVGLTPFLESMEDGIDTFIDDPQTLSNGQRQQISIARAMLKGAPLLILDEATSSVDTRTERHIQKAMDALMEGRTSFIIAHRLSTILSADKILVIKNGTILESGTHRELLAMNGFYRNLYDSQFEYCD